MKKSRILKACLAALIGAFCMNANAQVFTGLFGNNTNLSFTGGDFSAPVLAQKNFLTAGMRVPFNSTGTIYLAAQATAKYNFDLNDGSKDQKITLDLDLLKANAAFHTKNGKSALIALGRFPISDISGQVLAQNTDGLLVSLKSQRFSTAYSLAYTGLQDAYGVQMLNAEGATAEVGHDLGFYKFASPYAIVSASFSAPYLFANQTIGVETYAIAGVPGVSIDLGHDDPRVYLSFFINGPLMRFMFYDFTTTFESTEFKNISNLTTLNLSLFPGFKYFSINFSGTYASGANLGASQILEPFVGITQIAACGSAEAPVYSGIVKAGADVSMKPTDNLMLDLAGSAIFKFPETSLEFYGIDASFTAVWQIFTDVQVNAGVNAFIAQDPANTKYGASLNAVISF